MSKKYAGIGSRETPNNYLNFMNSIAKILAAKNYILRSGGATGADLAFQSGVKKYCDDKNIEYNKLMEIFIPWRGFNSLYPLKNSGIYNVKKTEVEEIARQFHPKYDILSNSVKKLMNRNVFQILGKNIDEPIPVDFVICYTLDGKDSGGTGFAIRLPQYLEIPVFNIFNEKDFNNVKEIIDE